MLKQEIGIMISSRYINPSDGAKTEAVHVWPQNLNLHLMILYTSLQISLLPVDYKALVIQAAAKSFESRVVFKRELHGFW
jgi:hypothetical protein